MQSSKSCHREKELFCESLTGSRQKPVKCEIVNQPEGSFLLVKEKIRGPVSDFENVFNYDEKTVGSLFEDELALTLGHALLVHFVKLFVLSFREPVLPVAYFSY